MPSEEEYWRRRRDALAQQLVDDEAELNRRLAELYEQEAAWLDREIASYYQRYGEDNVIEYRRLLVTLSDDDRRMLMEQMDEFAEQYPQYAHLLPVRASIYRLNELEGIQASIRVQQLRIGAIEQAELEAHFERQATRAANVAAEEMGFGENFYRVNDSVIQETVGAAWANGKHFSESVWDNRERLASYLNDDFAKMLARGVTYEEMARSLRDRFEHVSRRDSMRLIYTEGTFLLNEAQAKVHESDFEHYRLSCVNDGRACKVCRGLQAEQKERPARFDERAPGVNFPPLHPWCRCSYEVAVDDWDAWIDDYVAKRGGDAVTRAVESGTPDYSMLSRRQLRRLTENERAGHARLAQLGHDVRALPTDRAAAASIDLLMGGEYWELKTPIGTGARLKTRIAEGVSKWTRLKAAGSTDVGTPRIVVDVRFCSMCDDEAESVVRECMTLFSAEGFDEAIIICHDGSERHIGK